MSQSSWSLRLRDVRRAALRGLVIAGCAMAAAAARGLPVHAWASAASVFTVPFALSLLEVRARRLGADRAELHALLGCAVAPVVCVGAVLQIHYLVELFGGGPFDLQAAGERALLGLSRNSAPVAVIWALAGGTVHYCRAVDRAPIRTAAVVFLPGLFAGCVPYAFLVGGVILWTALLEVGDVLERGLRHALGRTQIQWDRETTWQLAYLGHAPARRALGGRAPAVNVDLVGWVRGLRACGEDVLRWAAEALARVLRPRVLERSYGPALAAWLDAPSPEQLEAARAALSEVTEVEPVWLVLRSTLEAAAQEGPWAAENMARLLAEAVGHLPATGESPPEVRDALSADLIAQVLARDTTNGQGGL